MAQDNINLGQAKNQALTVLMHNYGNKSLFLTTEAFSKDTEVQKKKYKELVKLFYNLNESVDQSVLQPSDKVKECPNCHVQIPDSWKQHYVCGWSDKNV